ncbi:MAG: hypothetical protein ACJ07L_16455, partial [Opitutales bacterium]
MNPARSRAGARSASKAKGKKEKQMNRGIHGERYVYDRYVENDYKFLHYLKTILDSADQRVVEFSSLEGFADQRQPE